jgi:uncharacterized lipoprotein YmbA
MSQRFVPSRAAFGLLLAALLAACVPPQSPTRYWTLSVVAAPTTSEARREKPVELGVGPVTVAEYLDRPQIVRRAGGNRLVLAENDNWPEPLASLIARVLTDDLAAMLPAARVHPLPARTVPDLDYRVEVQVNAFEGVGDDRALLDARWTLLRDRDGRVLLVRRSRIERPVTGGDAGALAAALSEAVAFLARDIADVVAAQQR